MPPAERAAFVIPGKMNKINYKKHWFSLDVNESNVNSNHFLRPRKEFLDPSYTPKNYHLFKVVENRMQQCCSAYIVHSCQQYCSALLSLNQPAIRCNNAEQYC